MVEIVLVVFDTGPLITLAAADSLDYLLLPSAPVLIPDAVLYEATVKAGALGAQDIRAWVSEHLADVRVAPTALFAELVAVREQGTPPGQLRALTRDIGERAALEVIGEHVTGDLSSRRGLLVVEDADAARAARLAPEVVVASTFDLLASLEAAGRINSADAVLRRAEDAGRLVARRSYLDAASEAEQAAAAAVLGMMRRPS